MGERHTCETWTNRFGKIRVTCVVCEQNWPCPTANVVAVITLRLFHERGKNSRIAWESAERTARALSQSFPVCVGMADD